MTTLAWDGRLLAADRQSTINGNTRAESTKIVDCSGYWFARVGCTEETSLVAEWLTAGCPRDESRSVLGDGMRGIAVRKKDGAVFVVEGAKLTLWKFDSRTFAIGSGSDYALAAMHLGKSAPEAIEVAMVFDPGTGLGIDVLDPRKGKVKRWTARAGR